MKRVTNREASSMIAALREFRNATGSLRGEKGRPGTLGWLPGRFRTMASLSSAEYVVYSYATPLAWFSRGVWYSPVTRYSSTTSRHQGYMRAGVCASGVDVLLLNARRAA